MLEGWRSSVVTMSSDGMQEVIAQPEFTNMGVHVSKTTLVLCPGPSREEDRQTGRFEVMANKIEFVC